jgi:hypothetical protein
MTDEQRSTTIGEFARLEDLEACAANWATTEMCQSAAAETLAEQKGVAVLPRSTLQLLTP